MCYRFSFIAGLIIATSSLLLPAADYPMAGFEEVRVASGLNPTSMAIAPDGRIFITEKSGEIRIVKDDVLLETPFATVASHTDNEAGLAGICLHPDFGENGWVYAYYTSERLRNRLVRFTADGDVADGPEILLMDLERWSAAHNGGALAFGPDGKLYLGTGDLYDYTTAPPLSQRLDSLWGKILRLDEDGTIPRDNPFYTTTSGKHRAIWALGLRNPFSAAFQPVTGRYFVCDVGAQYQEEVNQIEIGRNFGWPIVSGYHDSPNNNATIDTAAFTEPVLALSHDLPFGVSATTGAMFMPEDTPFPSRFAGRFLFGDYQHGWIRAIDPSAEDPAASMEVFATGIGQPLAFVMSPIDGSLYYLSRGGDEDNTASNDGSLWRVTFTGVEDPSIAVQPADLTVGMGADASFSVLANGRDLQYQWMQGTEVISGATGPVLDLADVDLASNGRTYSVVVSNPAGAVTSQTVTLSVIDGSAPVASIDTPSTDSVYRAGDLLAFSGSATDAEEDALPAAAMTWQVDFYHDEHHHPALEPTVGIASGSYQIPTTGETSANVWYRLTLTVVDSSGLAHTVTRDVHPLTGEFTLVTEPPGLALGLDGTPLITPIAITGVVGIERVLGAPTEQNLAGVPYQFSRWADVDEPNRTIAIPASATTYTAIYDPVPDDDGDGMGLTARFWNNPDQMGEPALLRTDQTVDFDWGHDAPAPGLERDDISARWSGTVEAPMTGIYTFHVTADDGVRLRVAGQLLIDRWVDQAATEYIQSIRLEAGVPVNIQMDWYDSGWSAVARLAWSSLSIDQTIIPRRHLYPEELDDGDDGDDGEPQRIRRELWTDVPGDTIDLGVLAEAPDSSTELVSLEGPVDVGDAYASRIRGFLLPPQTGSYRFWIAGDNASQLWIAPGEDPNQKRLIASVGTWTGWREWDKFSTQHSESIELESGRRYYVEVLHKEGAGGDHVSVGWLKPGETGDSPSEVVPGSALAPLTAANDQPPEPGDGSGLAAWYYDDRHLEAALVERIDPVVDFDWEGTTPDPAIAPNNYSARWVGTVEAPSTGTVIFHVIGDDGYRLMIDGDMVIDRWIEQPATETSSNPIELTKGQHYEIELEYFQGGGSAVVRLLWTLPDGSTMVIPEDRLYPPPMGVSKRPGVSSAPVDESPFRFLERESASGIPTSSAPPSGSTVFEAVGHLQHSSPNNSSPAPWSSSRRCAGCMRSREVERVEGEQDQLATQTQHPRSIRPGLLRLAD